MLILGFYKSKYFRLPFGLVLEMWKKEEKASVPLDCLIVPTRFPSAQWRAEIDLSYCFWLKQPALLALAIPQSCLGSFRTALLRLRLSLFIAYAYSSVQSRLDWDEKKETLNT